MKRDEERLLETLPQQITPPADLRGRIQADLEERGLVRNRKLSVTALWMAAVALLSFLVGLYFEPPFKAPDKQWFLLLLYQDENFASDVSEPELVEEYRLWAESLGKEGKLLDGHKLTDQGRRLGVAAGQGETLSGFFRVYAESLEEATALSQTCPHLKYGGTIEVRGIDLEAETQL